MNLKFIKLFALILFFLLIHFLSFIPKAFANEMIKLTSQSLASLIWLIVMVGGSITLTLIYVSYKKYKNTKKQETKDSEKS